MCKDEWIYPVDSLVISPGGEFIEGLWVQDVYSWGQRPPQIPRPEPKFRAQFPNEKYLEFLDRAQEKALLK